ncbi:ABC transporter ATP-binding protein [Glycomyces sp. TRM65418]|nr:ABC transporter ATP-binding protein [Glycomyces sp. TRM65418]MCC3764022.1 ABC transporter ATP-binding protein [Glycomyces sp. TRM65418]QZD53713.1 ABC transporter ATP-binding protein [Glycomyces sp. TRM65418]
MNAERQPQTGAAGLDAHLVVERDTGGRGRDESGFRLELRLRVAPGETVALLGPNGAGKTTALRALAGLEALSDGHIVLNGEVLDRPGPRRGRKRTARSRSPIDASPSDHPGTGVRRPSPDGSEQRGDRWVPPEHRGIGVVFQDYLLFPHLNAIDNVAFGPRRRGLGRTEARAHAADWLDRVGLDGFGKRRPGQLSGGQAQRVALARALATDPALLLLDEPLAALDARTRLDTRAELHRHLTGHPGAAVLVTHDPVDALMLADRLVVIEDGRAVQEGDAESVTARPRTDYIARLVGLNLYRGKASGRTVRLASGTVLTTAEPLGGAEADGEAFAAFAPSAVALYREEPDGSPRNTWRASVAGVHRHGDSVRVQLDGPLRAAADVTPAAAAQLGLEPGQTVWAAVKATEITAYPA